jgi:hypothetical protein
MSAGVPTNSARCQSFTAAELWVVNGIVASAATSASPVNVLAAAMTGAAMLSGTPGRFAKLARQITITRSSSAGSYSVSPIVITGTREGLAITESIVPGNINGNDVLTSVNLYTTITSIAFPAQVNTSGAFQIGSGNIGLQNNYETFTGVELLAAGTLNLQFGPVGTAVPSDVKSGVAGLVYPIAFKQLQTNPALAVPTTVGVTLYFP